jgi:3-oxoacyl-[acyl-carrier-protein] synthase II
LTIAVTGVGAVTALGDARTSFDRILAGERAFRPITLFDPGDVRTRMVAQVELARKGPRTGALAIAAFGDALRDANVDVRDRRVGLVIGGTTAGLFDTELRLLGLLRDGPPEAALRAHPLTGPTDLVVEALGPFARTRTLSSACSSGAQAIALGAAWLELGLVDAVVCGGADALCRVTFAGFHALGAMDPEGARPFDARRRGLTLGEGAGAVVLERASSKRAICTLLGWAARSEAHHITNPEESGEAPLRAMEAALARAGLRPRDVAYVNAHGTGTRLNDAMETRALGRLFGDDLQRVAVSGQKGMLGHTLAAAGAIEAVITALAIERGKLPPTGGLDQIDPECGLRHVLAAESQPIDVAISNAFGFGGMDASLVLGAPDRVAPSATRHPVYVRGIAARGPSGAFVGADVVELPAGAPADVALPSLDPERARRMDRASVLAAGCIEDLAPPPEAGIVFGQAFGAIEATTALVERLATKGARMVRPADFPGLVPSSPAGHVSIYAGLRGPSVVVADGSLSGDAAIAHAIEMIAVGDADHLVAGASEEASTVVERRLRATFGDGRYTIAERREGAGFLHLSSETGVARIEPVAVDALPEPPAGAVVVVRERADLDATSWSRVPVIACERATGAHEAAGAMVAAVAVAQVASGRATCALFMGTAAGRSYAAIVWPV